MSDKQERHQLQSLGKHPAPCARFCESTAYEIEIRQLKARIAELEAQRGELYTLDQMREYADNFYQARTTAPAPSVPDHVAAAARHFKAEGGHIGGLGASRAANILWDYINDVLAAAPKVNP